MRDLCNLFDWLNRADFVVGMHYGDKECARSQGAANIVRIDSSKSISPQVFNRRTKPFEEPTGINYRRMFHLRGNDMGIGAPICEEHPFESVIVGFTSTASEYDFVVSATQKPSNLHSSFVDRLSRGFSGPVIARWIAIWLFEDTLHRRDHFWRYGGAGIEIEVNALISSCHHSWALSAFIQSSLESWTILHSKHRAMLFHVTPQKTRLRLM